MERTAEKEYVLAQALKTPQGRYEVAQTMKGFVVYKWDYMLEQLVRYWIRGERENSNNRVNPQERRTGCSNPQRLCVSHGDTVRTSRGREECDRNDHTPVKGNKFGLNLLKRVNLWPSQKIAICWNNSFRCWIRGERENSNNRVNQQERRTPVFGSPETMCNPFTLSEDIVRTPQRYGEVTEMITHPVMGHKSNSLRDYKAIGRQLMFVHHVPQGAPIETYLSPTLVTV